MYTVLYRINDTTKMRATITMTAISPASMAEHSSLGQVGQLCNFVRADTVGQALPWLENFGGIEFRRLVSPHSRDQPACAVEACLRWPLHCVMLPRCPPRVRWTARKLVWLEILPILAAYATTSRNLIAGSDFSATAGAWTAMSRGFSIAVPAATGIRVNVGNANAPTADDVQ